MSEFVDIKIIDLALDRTAHSDTAPGLRHMYLELSDRPPAEWSDFFDQERQFPRHSMWRHAWIEGNHIVVDCVPDEIERYHLADLKQDVTGANAHYNEHRRAKDQQLASAKAAEAAEKERLEQLRSKRPVFPC